MDDPFPPASRLLAYCRDSGGRDQELSIPQQEQKIGEWCKAHGYALVRIFRDAARSGTTTAGRDAFLDMFSYLSRGSDVAGVVLWEYARFSRNYNDAQYYLADLRRQGYAVYSLSDQVPEGLEGQLMEGIISWKNARFSADLSRNIRRGLSYVVTAFHGWPHREPPPGYRKIYYQAGSRRDGSPHMVARLEIDEDAAPLVRRAFAMRLQGSSYREIAAAVSLYTHNTRMRELLHNSIYIGVYSYSGLHVEGYCPPLVDLPTWTAVQAINAEASERHGRWHPRRINSTFLLSGLLRCGVCGRPMIGLHTTNSKRQPGIVYSYYQCANKPGRSANGEPCPARNVRAAVLEERVIALLLDLLDQPQILIDTHAEIERQSHQGDASRQSAERFARADLSTVQKSIHNITEAIRAAGHSQALLADLASLEAERERLELHLFDLETATPVPAPPVDIANMSYELRHALSLATGRELQRLVRLTVTSVRARSVDGEISGEIEYRIGDVSGSLAL